MESLTTWLPKREATRMTQRACQSAQGKVHEAPTMYKEVKVME